MAHTLRAVYNQLLCGTTAAPIGTSGYSGCSASTGTSVLSVTSGPTGTSGPTDNSVSTSFLGSSGQFASSSEVCPFNPGYAAATSVSAAPSILSGPSALSSAFGHSVIPDFSGCTDEFLDALLDTGDFWSVRQKPSGAEIWYKNTVRVMTFDAMQRELPPLAEMHWKHIESIPYFTSGLPSIREAAAAGRPIGLEGGPCVFGAWEVFMEITLADGSTVVYDFNTNSCVAGDDYDLTAPPLPDFLAEHAASVRDICFRDCKEGLTGQEIDSVLFLFEAGRALHGHVILSIPDMSYCKYLLTITACLPKNLQEQTLARFRRVAWRITDLYLELAQYMSRDYPDVVYTPVHERAADHIAAYYEKRVPFIDRHKVLKKISTSHYKLEAVKDYISLSALPMYLFGITDVLHICSLDESDSFRKCREAHKGTLNLACILYPEYFSTDREHTVFYAKKPYKDYLAIPDYRERCAQSLTTGSRGPVTE